MKTILRLGMRINEMAEMVRHTPMMLLISGEPHITQRITMTVLKINRKDRVNGSKQLTRVTRKELDDPIIPSIPFLTVSSTPYEYRMESLRQDHTLTMIRRRITL